MIALSYPKVKQLKPYIFAEPFAGSAALTYWLLGGKPPISYCGSKQGYAPVIADILGLSQHHKPAGIILGEPGPFAAVHATLGGASGSAEDVAGWLTCAGQSFRIGHPDSGYNKTEAEGGNWETHGAVRPWMERIAPTIPDLPLPAARQVANIIRSWKDEEPRALWERLKAKGWPSLLLPEGCRGRWLGPDSVETVAAYFAAAELVAKGDPAAGYAGEQERHDAGRCWTKPDLIGVAARTESLPTFPPLAVYQGFAEDLALPADLSGVVMFADPPYENTTGYKHGTCNRETVLRLARDWSGRGAIVAISEAVRLDRELGDGWHAVQIDHARRGAKRTFSKQQDEWLTLNRPPQYVPPKQQGLFQ